MDPRLLAAQMIAESGGDPGAVSKAGAVGLMQLMPDTAQGLGVSDTRNPLENMLGGALYLRQQIERFGNIPLALAAYNWGPEKVAHVGGDFSKMPAETQSYVANVLGMISGAP